MTGAPILTTQEMRAAEQALFESGVDPYALMGRAGEGAAELIWRAGHKRETLVLCGPGNNGGDGYVVARALRERGVKVRVAALAEPATTSAARARSDWGGPVEALADAPPATQVVDALFGIGLTRGLDPALAERLGALVGAAQHSYAIDVPSGVESDCATCLSPVPAFDLVIALGAWKPAHLLMPTRVLARQRALVDIGIPAPEGGARLLEAPHISAPAPDAHKYSRGLVAVAAGAMPGAAALCAEAAARGGAGYVRLIGAEGIAASHAIVQQRALSFDKAKAVLVGPGLGRDDAARARLAEVLAADLPTVLDADALMLLAADCRPLPARSILTPHEGEFAALFGTGDGSKIERTRAAAQSIGAVVVHKGPDTVIAAPDGRAAVADTGSPWLSTAGTGDVLAGLCAARLAVTGDVFCAACEAVWLHGAAARRAGAAFLADDLLRHIPAVIARRA